MDRLSEIIDNRIGKLFAIIFAVVALMAIGILPAWLGDSIISFSVKSLFSPTGIILELFGISLVAIAIGAVIYLYKNNRD